MKPPAGGSRVGGAAGDRRRGAAARCRRFPRGGSAAGCRAPRLDSPCSRPALAAAFGAGDGGSAPQPRGARAFADRAARGRRRAPSPGRSCAPGAGDRRALGGGRPIRPASTGRREQRACWSSDASTATSAPESRVSGTRLAADGRARLSRREPRSGRAGGGTRLNARGVDLNRNFGSAGGPSARPATSSTRARRVLRARDAPRPAPDPKPAPRRDDLVSPGTAAAGARLGPERPRGATVALYARLSGDKPFSTVACRGSTGTAPNWQNHRFAGHEPRSWSSCRRPCPGADARHQRGTTRVVDLGSDGPFVSGERRGAADAMGGSRGTMVVPGAGCAAACSG